MIEAAVFVYFAIIVLGVALVAFPAWRVRVFGALTGIVATHVSGVIGSGNRAGGFVLTSCRLLVVWARDFLQLTKRRPYLVMAGFVLLGIPTLLAVLGGGDELFDYSGNRELVDPQVVALLEGEQLVPPPPLPPEVFTTQEVEQVRPDVVDASRNWGQLDTQFTQRLLAVFKLMKERHGYDMVLLEGFRSPERQAKLAAMGAHVTQAGPYMSYHQYGLAADSAFLRDGKIVISERDPWAMRGYQLYGEVAEQLGLTWGGRWKMMDLGHVELRRPNVLGKAL